MRLALFLLLFSVPLLAQRQLAYPVKVNHLWGFVTADSEWVVEPKYDAIATRYLGWTGNGDKKDNSGFRLVQANDRLGLLDSNLHEVLQPRYLRIRPLSQNLFAVVLPQSPITNHPSPVAHHPSPVTHHPSPITTHLFTIVNRQGERTVEGSFEDVHLLAGTSENACKYVKVRQGDRWGVFAADGKQILPPAYAEVEFCDVEDGFFKVKKEPGDSLWSLLDSRRKVILPPKFLEIQVVAKNCFAARPARKNWGAWDADGKILLQPVWQKVAPLNRHLASLQDAEGRWRIYSYQKQDTVSFSKKFAGFKALDNHHVVAFASNLRNRQDDFSGGRMAVMLDSTGKEIKTPVFREIRSLQDSLFLGMQGAWGIFTLDRGIVTPCIYDSIGQFENGMAFVFRNGMSGILSQNLKIWVPPMLEEAVQQDSIIKAWDGENVLKVYRIDPVDTLLFLQNAENVRQIRVRRGTVSYAEAALRQARQRTGMPAFSVSAPAFWREITGTNFNWELDPATARYGLQKWSEAASAWKFESPGYAKLALDLSEARLSLVYDTNAIATAKTPFADVLPEAEKLYPFALFQHQNGKLVTGTELLALRVRDFKRRLPFAAFFDLDGRMGLVNRNGEQVKDKAGKPLKFSYVGEFFEGKARVCLGGKLAITSAVKEEKFGVVKTGELLREFGMLTDLPASELPDTLLLLESPEGEKTRWGFIDTLGNMVIEPVYDFVQNFQGGEVVAQKNGLWGVLDEKGKPLLDFRYVNLAPFHGYWKVGEKAINTLFFDEKGRQISEGNYRRQGVFAGGFCRVQRDSVWGFINEKGAESVACRFEAARDFSEGLAAVKLAGKWGFIDSTGNFAFDLQAAAGGEVESVGDFHAGLAWFKTGGTKGYLDRNGKVRIESKFINAFDFQQVSSTGAVSTLSADSTPGYSAVSTLSAVSTSVGSVARVVYLKKTGLIDTAGNFILEPKRFERISEFNAWGVAVAWEKFADKKCCLVNARGEALTPVKYVEIGEFREGFAPVFDGKNRGLINRQGKEVLPLEFEKVGEVAEGLVAVRHRQQPGWQYLDTLGTPAFKGSFEVAQPFVKGFATVQVNEYDPESKMVIDRQGKKVPFPKGSDFHGYSEGIFSFWSHASVKEGGQDLHYYFADANARNLFGQYFQDVEPFSEGIALVKKRHRWGMVNQFGLPVIEPKYPFPPKRQDGSTVVNLGVAFGILDKKGKPVIPSSFDRIEWMEGNVFRLELGEKIGYADAGGAWIWELRK